MSNYRTGVLNDFSTVSKAKFYVLESKGNNLILKDTLPVQINPSEFRLECKSNMFMLEGLKQNTNPLLGTGGIPLVKRKRTRSLEDIDIPLRFDIYDEYNVRTLEGVDVITTDMSLTNEKLTSLPNLIKCWKEGNYVKFMWGKIDYFGIISNISGTYSAFSRWGDPLKCDATVTLSEQPIDSADGGGIMTSINAALKQIKVKEAALKAIDVATLAASKALR